MAEPITVFYSAVHTCPKHPKTQDIRQYCAACYIAELQAKLAAVVGEIGDLMNESFGVDGLRLNGDVADWQWLMDSGWLENTKQALEQQQTPEDE